MNCYACGRRLAFPDSAKVVYTGDDGGQRQFVGGDCFAKVEQAGDAGYQPPGGGPRLFLKRTAKMHDDYKRLEIPTAYKDVHIESCPVCNARPELWQYSESVDAPVEKVLMCTTTERIGPRDGLANEGCLLYMPPNDFYRETIRGAIAFWNGFAVALRALRETRPVEGSIDYTI